jgi:hypothetical protein
LPISNCQLKKIKSAIGNWQSAFETKQLKGINYAKVEDPQRSCQAIQADGHRKDQAWPFACAAHTDEEVEQAKAPTGYRRTRVPGGP